MSLEPSQRDLSDALRDWHDAWEDGEDLAPGMLRPDWSADQLAQLGCQIEKRKELFRRCSDTDLLLPTRAYSNDNGLVEMPEIPGYRILHVLAEGGQGVVFKAEDNTVAGRFVAVKLINRSWFTTDEDRQRFLREAQTLSDLDHPHIVKLFHAGYYKDQPYVVLELCARGSLSNDERVKDGGVLSPKDAASLIATLSTAIEVAHQYGSVHRDLKPDNILLTEKGVPKITDFGLAKREGDTALTRTGQGFGTPGYWAPEQVSGDSKATGPHTDIFGLGATLYRLLTGLPPLKRDLPFEELPRAYDSIRPPRENRPEVPRDLEAICMKCLEKHPEDRYRSAREFTDDLNCFLMGEPVEARPVSAQKRIFRTLTRSRLDPTFHTWDKIALITAAFLSLQAVWTLIFFQLDYPEIAYGVVGGTGIFWVGMFTLIAMTLRKNLEQGRQFTLCIGVNLIGCLIMQRIQFGSFLPVFEAKANVWAPSAAINGVTLGLLGLFLDWRFFLGAGVFAVVAIILSEVPFQWSCFGYGQAWTLLLVALSIYLRRLKPEGEPSEH